MNYVNYENQDYRQNTIFVDETKSASLMSKVYLWMFMGLGLTALSSWLSAINGWLYSMGSVGVWGLLILEIVLVMGMSAAIRKISVGVATFMFIAYSILNGITLSAIFGVYSISSIVISFVVSSVMFAVLALWGTITKKDMSSLGRILMPALIALMITIFISIFWVNTVLELIISVAGVVIFSGLIVYDSNKIKQLSQELDPYNSDSQKIALMGALTMYLDFINLFLFLLRLLGRSK